MDALGNVAQVRQALELVRRIPAWWLVLVLALAAVSCVDVEYALGDWSLKFRVTGVTAAILATVWLPSVVALLILAGGSAKTPAGDFSTGGLLAALTSLPESAQKEALPPVIAALDTAEGRRIAARSPEAAEARDELERRLDSLPTDHDEAVRQLENLASEYEVLRRSLPPGRDRTYRMTLVLTRARALGRQAGLEAPDVHSMLLGSDGERIVGLAVAQGRPEHSDAEELLGIVLDSRSAFEQYAALEALIARSSSIPADLRGNILASMRQELSRPGTFLQPGADRYALARALIAVLTS
jgi:hypothetical protein